MTAIHDHIIWRGIKYNTTKFIHFCESKLCDNEIEEWEKDIYLFAREWLNFDKKTFNIQTSGSTSTPKVISLSRQDMIDSAQATGKYFKLKTHDSALLCLPANFIAGKMMIVRSLVLHLDLYYCKPSISALENINRPYDFCAAIPLQIQYVFDHDFIHQLNNIKTIIIGGANLEKKYKTQLNILNTKAYATYGMTETITHIALQRLNGIGKTSFFTCLPGIQVEQDERDCLVIKKNTGNVKQWKTNDLVAIFSPTTFSIIGRIDDIINSGGLKINPVEIEDKINHLINGPFMIGYRVDSELGQKVILIIEKKEELENMEIVLEEIRKIIPNNSAPKELYYINKLYRTTNNKLDRKRVIQEINL